MMENPRKLPIAIMKTKTTCMGTCCSSEAKSATSARCGVCKMLIVSSITQYMGAAKYKAVSLEKMCSADENSIPATHVETNPARMTGRRRPKLDVQLSEVAP